MHFSESPNLSLEYTDADIPIKARIQRICRSIANMVSRRNRDPERLHEEIKSLHREFMARFDTIETDIHETRGEIKSVRSDIRKTQKAVKRVEDSIEETRIESHYLRANLPKEIQRRFESISEQQFLHRARSILDRIENVLKALEFKTPTKFDLAKIKVLRDLLKDGYVGGKHTSVEHAVGSLATDEKSYGKEAIKELIRNGMLLDKTTHYGRQISIHPKKTLEVKTILRCWGVGFT